MNGDVLSRRHDAHDPYEENRLYFLVHYAPHTQKRAGTGFSFFFYCYTTARGVRNSRSANSLVLLLSCYFWTDLLDDVLSEQGMTCPEYA